MSEFWILIIVIVVGFIITWIVCSKMPDTPDFDYKPDKIMMINPYDAEKEELRRKVYTLERELYYRRYDRPVEVNVDVKVDLDETISKSSCR